MPARSLEPRDGWASTISTSVDHLPALLDVLARVALLARRLGHRRVRIVEGGEASPGTVVLGAAAELLGEAAGVTLQVVSSRIAPHAELHRPIGCVVVDVDDAEGLDDCFALLDGPAATLLPEVLVAIRAGPTCATAEPAGVDAFNRGHPRRLLRRAGVQPGLGRSQEGLRPTAALFVLDVAEHPHHGALTAARVG